MFDAPELNQFLETAHTVMSQPVVHAEINMNSADNIERIGVYRYRPNGFDAKYRGLPISYDPFDNGDHYTDAEMGYAEIGGTYEDGTDVSSQVIFRQDNDRLGRLYSLEDCFRPNRPRSGINKFIFLGSGGISRSTPQFFDGASDNPAMRPRFYVSSGSDHFKYWTSYKQEGKKERGISYAAGNSYLIDDAVPFVVYKNPVPANRIVVKMQTLVGEEDRGQIFNNGQYIADPLFGDPKVPAQWDVEVLQEGSWNRAYSFSGSDRIGPDGYMELGYGIVVPSNHSNYVYMGEVTSQSLLPDNANENDLWLVRSNEFERGLFYIGVDINGTIQWDTFVPEYGWHVEPNGFNNQSSVLKNIVDPPFFGTPPTYREFQMIGGIRIVVRSMRHLDTTFDLIELSPRLVMDWTDRTAEFSVSKTMGDLSGSSVPVGTLMASTGNISVNNNDSAFNVNNPLDPKTGIGSVAAYWSGHRAKILFYDKVMNVNGYDYFVPIKTLYTETTPDIKSDFDEIEISLRDRLYLFETMSAPSLLMTDVSLSRAVMTLMDNIGFTNYTFKRLEGQVDPVIPYFFIPPDRSVIEVLVELALATQSSMFLDEFNNLVVASKEYIMPDPGQRKTDLVVRGHDEDGKLANIKAISSAERPVYNAGQIDYTKRYIQRTSGVLDQALYQPQDKTWVYAPTMVWEASADSTTAAMNENAGVQEAYTLSAVPLSTDLSDAIPIVRGAGIINNTFNVGEAANYMSRHNGYFYANGEIIRYDAIQYSVSGTGNVWIESADQYQTLALSLPFGGKIYPTGLIRIWCEPYYRSNPDGSATLQVGPVKSHGRGQFGTKITSHSAGLSSYWSDPANVGGMVQNPDPLFNLKEEQFYQQGLKQNVPAGRRLGNIDGKRLAERSTRNGIMNHHMSRKFWSESEINRMTSAKAGTMQSSALVFTGPAFPADADPRNHISYVFKPLTDHYTNFGTRCRIIGKAETGSSVPQTPIGSTTFFKIPSTSPSSQTHIAGGSGGVAIHVDPKTNAGYFFEIAALTGADPSSYEIPDIESKTLIGTVTAVTVNNGIVTITYDSSGAEEEAIVRPEDNISVSGVFIENGPHIGGVRRVMSVTSSQIEYEIMNTPYTWINDFGKVSKGGVDLGRLTGAAIDESGTLTFTTLYPTGLFVGDTVSLTGFNASSETLDPNKEASVTLVSSDGRTVSVSIPKFSGSWTPSEYSKAEVHLVSSDTPQLSNIWFYKTVADDMGGGATHVNRTASYTELEVPGHRLSAGDIVTVDSAVGSVRGDYQVTYISGQVVRLNRGGSSINGAIADTTIGLLDPVATTYKLWSGLSNILVDGGLFWGQYRAMAEDNTTVYDLGIEYIDSSRGRTFYLFINNRQVATVFDPNPLVKVNNMALFVRGQTRMMFENVYALGENIIHDGVAKQVQPAHISEAFGIPDGINESDALRKYAVSGFVQSSFLSGISSQTAPKYNMYYEEFGTIMREAAYFNIKYDAAYPALYAKLAPVLNRIKGYTVSGFMADAYGAEFMVFNNLDNLCRLDPETGNYLRIFGITFTQETTKTLTVDDYMSDVDKIGDGKKVIRDPGSVREIYDSIKISRMKYGKNEFQIASDYIQTDDQANRLMGWLIGKMNRGRLNIGISLFQTPTIQLGDIITMSYRDHHDNDILVSSGRQFVVYSIEYSKAVGSAEMTIYATEV